MDFITLKELFHTFNIYLRNNNIKETIKEAEFKQRVTNIFPFKPRHSYLSKDYRSVFTNIKAKQEVVDNGNASFVDDT